jgi:ABC-type multidrug transport system fused ATPase/permease subunit
MSECSRTIVGERGATLSGGQRQSISIARDVVRATPILILGEPTSGLDSTLKQIVIAALNRLMEGKAAIVIAHHLNTIRRADGIFVIEDSEFLAKGSLDQVFHVIREQWRQIYEKLKAIEKEISIFRVPLLCFCV